MRISCLFFFLVCFSATVQSQVPANVISLEDAAFDATYSKRSIPAVTGKLFNISAEELKNTTITYALITPFALEVKKTAHVRPDGSFKLELEYAFPYQQVYISIDTLLYACLYIDKGLQLELDMKKIRAAKVVQFNGDGVSYVGADGPMNIYLNNYILYKRSEKEHFSTSTFQLSMARKRPVADLIADYNKISDSLKEIEDSFIAINPSPFRWILENERLTDYYTQIYNWHIGKVMDDSLWQKAKQHKSYLVSGNRSAMYGSMYAYISWLPGAKGDVNWKDLATLPDLDIAEKKAIDSLRQSETMKPAYPYTPENIEMWVRVLRPRIQKISRFRFIDKTILIMDSMLPPAKADLLKFQLNSSSDLVEQKEILDYVHGYVHTDWCASVIKKESIRTAGKINETNKVLAASGSKMKTMSFGTPVMETSFGASMYKASGLKADDFLSKLKQSFPGKAILIDLWATWCVPCLGEMEHSKKLLEESKDLPVVFVYLCTLSGSAENKWKSKVAELKQPGIHILINETLDAELFKYFSFLGYPGHAFIDKAGNYRPRAITWMAEIENREALTILINK